MPRKNFFRKTTKKRSHRIDFNKPRDVYTIYYPNTSLGQERYDPGFLRIVSVDPGQVNYAIRIEDRYPEGNVFTHVYEKHHIRDEAKRPWYTIDQTLTNLTSVLNSYDHLYDHVRFVFVERQPPKRNANNTQVMQHTTSYFVNRLRNLPTMPEIYELDTHLKGAVLGKPDDEDTKDWSMRIAPIIHKYRKDDQAIEKLEKVKKKDDLCDTCVQIEAALRFFVMLSTKNFKVIPIEQTFEE